MDEATAKTKWCPMVRLKEIGFETTSVGHNREFSIDDTDSHDNEIWKGTNCIGSACMMWKGERLRLLAYEDTGEFLPIDVTLDTAEESIIHNGRKASRKNRAIGYCGLAGKP